ncbi:hypothetical protein EON81_18450 [bacterium]|nr:MAG: hypothetical protein EON81_18450 [bacterium]
MASMDETYLVELSDGSKFGPADFATLKDWVSQGRIHPSTMLIAQTTGQRLRADSLDGLFGTVMPGAPPIAPPMSAPVSQPAPASSNKNTLWIILAVLVGVCGCGTVILAAILLPVFSQAKMAAKRTAGLSSMKELSLGVLMYMGDADDRFPPVMDSALSMKPMVEPYVKDPSVFTSKNEKGGEILSDPRLAGRFSFSIADPSKGIMLYDSLPWQGDRSPVGYIDGSARLIPHASIASIMAPDPFGGITREQEERDYATPSTR